MDFGFLGIGWQELLFLVVLILLIVGPKDMVKWGRNLGHWLNRLQRSENYQLVRKASEELRNLPSRLAREAQLEELQKDLGQTQQELRQTTRQATQFDAWVKPLEAPAPKPAAAPPPAPPEPPSAAK